MEITTGSLQGSQSVQLPVPPDSNAREDAQRAFRSRSDSLDIFTMSPLGTPPFDAYPNAQDDPSAPQLRLPDPPVLDLDIGASKAIDRASSLPQRSPSPPSTPSSPAYFSFSPSGRPCYQVRYGDASYPFESQYGSQSGGTSYGTDMTSVFGSWDVNERHDGHSEVVYAQDDMGKSAQHEALGSHTSLGTTLESTLEKGKGKAVETVDDDSTEPPSPSHTPFEFDTDFQHTANFDLSSRSDGHSHHDDDAGLYEPPIVRLSPGSGYRQFAPSGDDYAGPSSRNGDMHVSAVEDAEHVPLTSSPVSSPHTHVSPVSSPRPTSPLPTSGAPSPSISEMHSRLRQPTHRRSFSSLSLRSIRSSSSRSIASIRSAFTGVSVRGKVRSMAPAAKKLKGGLRKMFKRNGAGTVTDATQAALDDEDDSDDEGSPSDPRHVVESGLGIQDHGVTRHDLPGSPPPELVEPNAHGHSLEASSDSQATVTYPAASGVMHIPDIVPEGPKLVVPTKARSMSEPIPFARPISQPAGQQDDSPEALREETSEVEMPKPEPVVTILPNRFNDMLPRELQITVLQTLVGVHEADHTRAERDEGQDQVWSVSNAGKTRWVGRDKGLRELVKLTRVSRAWQSLAFDGQLWNALHLVSSPPHLSPALLLRLADRAGSFVRSLDLRGWTHLDPVTLRALVRSLSLAPALDVFPSPPSSTVPIRMPPFPPTNLTHVSLRTCTSLTSHSLHHVLLRAPHLRSIDLRGLSAVTNTTCGVLSAYCPKLDTADLGRCGNMDGDGLRELVGGGALARSWTNEEGGRQITPVHTAAVPLERPISKLKVLRVSGLKRTNEKVLTDLGQGAPELEVLDLSGARDITDEAIEAFVAWDEKWDIPSSYHPLHRKVELSAREVGRDPTTDFGPFFKRVTHLRHLNLSSCPLITDGACTHLAHCVPQLEFLELAGVGQDLKDDGLIRLLCTIPFLRRLDLEDASDISDAVLEALTPSAPVEVRRRGVLIPPQPQPGHKLEHLVLSYALNVTNDALLALIHGCERLTTLECDNTRISGAVLREFVKLARQRRLRGAEIVAVDCRAITEALVKDLAGSGQTRARKGYRHYEARTLGYVDAKDEEDIGITGILGGIDINDCDDTRVALKSFWSWQAVDAIRQAREKRRRQALNARRNTDTGVLGDVFRRGGILDEEGLFGAGGEGPSRPRWLTHWTRTSGSGSSSPTGMSSVNDEERGCIVV